MVQPITIFDSYIQCDTHLYLLRTFFTKHVQHMTLDSRFACQMIFGCGKSLIREMTFVTKPVETYDLDEKMSQNMSPRNNIRK